MRSLEEKNEFIHSWYLLLTSFLVLLFLLISPVIWINCLVSFFSLILFSQCGLDFKVLRRLILYTFLFSIVFLILNLLYPAPRLRVGEIITILSFNFYKGALINGVKLFFKLFLLSLISMSSTYVINYTKVILFLMIQKKLSVFFGYPLLIALNSIFLFKEEFSRIKLSARLRGLGLWSQLFVFFPLLVFAIRHSQRGALSLVTRGLNPDKGFYFDYQIKSRDHLIFRVILSSLICLMAITIYFR